jgi:hypothetical protein
MDRGLDRGRPLNYNFLLPDICGKKDICHAKPESMPPVHCTILLFEESSADGYF